MSTPTYRTAAVVNASLRDGKYMLSAAVSLSAKEALDAMAKQRKITRCGLAREILTRIAERPELLRVVLPEQP